MGIRSQSLFQAILARISLGAIPVDGSYWFDPPGPRESQTPAEGGFPDETRVPEVDWSRAGGPLSSHRGAAWGERS